ncbi:hypothetical protein [Thermococcus sp.]|uniref:hypothetical protein n=1 Tax=Thermococcus sp. TaxID=35749 RepID=UPI0026380A4D|nr:hypothetical protein [Thermococcus sp.]
MFNVFYGKGRRSRALFFSLLVVVIVSMVILGMAYSSYEAKVKLEPYSASAFSLSGYLLQSVYIEVHSSEPVSLCITDTAGLDAIYSGGQPICYFYRPSVTDVETLWRFPTSGEFYLVLVSGERGAEVWISLRSGPIVW